MSKKENIFDNLFVFEMANNHMGDLNHGLSIIREIHKVSEEFDFRFGFKLQYRDLDTFIHPQFKENFEFKYVKRFSETALSEKDKKILKDEITKLGFISICTPFDEISVDLIEKHNFDIIKIGSCSATDWPLLERVVKLDKPIILSTAGLAFNDLDKVVSFFQHREKAFALMHCVAEYPTPKDKSELNQIDLLKGRYAQVDVGYSAHEEPGDVDAIKIAIAKGARLFEKHVGLAHDSSTLNAYSATPDQVKLWLESAKDAFNRCGTRKKRYLPTDKETASLRGLRRGLFVKEDINRGDRVEPDNIFLAIPTQKDQVTANDMSKYTDYYAQTDIPANDPLLLSCLKRVNNREEIYEIVQKIKSLLKKSGVLVPEELDLEISHHYGVERFYECGCALINFVNREYCKKLIVMLPGQEHPEQYHKVKEETFQVLYGDILLDLAGIKREHKSGDIITINRNTKHSFSSKKGAVIEEISSTHHGDDSYYTDKAIAKNDNRKTMITYWLE
ncbi:N-acetylneuraminate synthase family protein [Candidatus Omnitrophota bacterium]